MNAPAKFPSGQTRSLWDVLEINGQVFLDAVANLRGVQAIIDNWGDEESRNQPVGEESTETLLPQVDALLVALGELSARNAAAAARRMRKWVLATG